MNEDSINLESLSKPFLDDIDSVEQSNVVAQFERIGGSGTGIDIVARQDVYIIGNNNRIYRYNLADNKFYLEPGGGTGKRISATSNQLVIIGSNDRVYVKNMGSTNGWTMINNNCGTSNCSSGKDISANRESVTISDKTMAVSGINNKVYVYKTLNQLLNWYWMTDLFSPGNHSIVSLSVAINHTNNTVYTITNLFINGNVLVGEIDKAQNSQSLSAWSTVGVTAKDIAVGPTGDLAYISMSGDIHYQGVTHSFVGSNIIVSKITVADNNNIYFIDSQNRIYRLNY